VKIVDANVLLYAVNEADPKHEPSRRWLDAALTEGDTVGFSWLALLAFLRLSTKIGLFPAPLPVDVATATVRAWLTQPSAVVVEPGARHLDVLAGLLHDLGTGGNVTSDAHLAAMASELGATIVTWDGDFARFAGVRWQRPTG
jgi:toxin-antitoxin system PIN domain toxin